MPRQLALRLGSGPRRPQEFVVCTEPSTICAPVPFEQIADFGRVKHLKVRLDLALDRKVPNPDRADVGAKAVGAAGFVGLEDLAGQEDGPVEVSPADEGMIGIELGETQQALHGRRVFGERRRQRPLRTCHVEEPLPAPVGFDLAVIGLRPTVPSESQRTRVKSHPVQ